MAATPTEYTYGAGRGIRTYTSTEYHAVVLNIQEALNKHIMSCASTYPWTPIKGADTCGNKCTNNYQYNVCFLNRYDNKEQHLGWHADDSPGMDHKHPIAVVSFGQPREIWWRENGHKGEIPLSQRQLLDHGSLFVMPEGFQLTHQHKIPKGDRTMAPRVSLTYRHYVPEEKAP